MRKLILLLALTLTFGCSNESEILQNDVIQIESFEERNVPVRAAVLTPTVEGELASLELTESAANPTHLQWTVNADQNYHVVIQNEAEQWLLQTNTNGATGFYIGGYYKNKDPNDGNIWIVKGQQYYLYFINENISVPFTLTGRIN